MPQTEKREEGKSGFNLWSAPEPRAVFLLVHGLGAHSGRWEAMAGFFTGKGISSYAVELRDPRLPDNAPGEEGYFGDYFRKVLSVYQAALKDNPSKKVFLIGESMGALISFLLAALKPGLFSGLICMSPAFGNRLRLSPYDCLKISISMFSPQKAHFKLPFNSAMCTRDAAYRDIMDSDPREYRAVPVKLLLEILAAQIRAGKAKKDVAIPTLFLIAGQDRISDPVPAGKIYNGMASRDKTLVEFPGMYHALSIDTGRESVFEEILKWVEKRL
jgi:alpha-beta hydrolase superfamily lysophospholipase